jgi:hypothetical protein
MDAVSASISMAFADKEVLASRWLIRWSGAIQLIAFILEGLALDSLPSSKVADNCDEPCYVVLPWIISFNSQHAISHEIWIYFSFRLVLWLAQFLLGLRLKATFNVLEHARYEESRILYGPRWERVPATVTTSYLIFFGTIVIHIRYLVRIRDEVGLRGNEFTILISEWGQSVPLIICIAAFLHVVYVQLRLFSTKAWKNREGVRMACKDPSKKHIEEDVSPTHRYQRHPMTLFTLLQPVDHCLIFPIEDGLESEVVNPESLSDEKKQELWERLM